MPDTYSESESFYEVFVTLFGFIALATQYLNLYRTVWWLPHSYTNTAMVNYFCFKYFNIMNREIYILFCFQNFYLIDPHLVGFSVIILARRCFWIFLKLVRQTLNFLFTTISDALQRPPQEVLISRCSTLP